MIFVDNVRFVLVSFRSCIWASWCDEVERFMEWNTNCQTKYHNVRVARVSFRGHFFTDMLLNNMYCVARNGWMFHVTACQRREQGKSLWCQSLISWHCSVSYLQSDSSRNCWYWTSGQEIQWWRGKGKCFCPWIISYILHSKIIFWTKIM